MLQRDPWIKNGRLAVKLSSIFRGILGLVLHILRSKWRNEVRDKSSKEECLLDIYEPYPHSVQRLMATIASWGHYTYPICGQGFGAASEVLWDRGWELSKNWGVLAKIFLSTELLVETKHQLDGWSELQNLLWDIEGWNRKVPFGSVDSGT